MYTDDDDRITRLRRPTTTQGKGFVGTLVFGQASHSPLTTTLLNEEIWLLKDSWI